MKSANRLKILLVCLTALLSASGAAAKEATVCPDLSGTYTVQSIDSREGKKNPHADYCSLWYYGQKKSDYGIATLTIDNRVRSLEIRQAACEELTVTKSLANGVVMNEIIQVRKGVKWDENTLVSKRNRLAIGFNQDSPIKFYPEREFHHSRLEASNDGKHVIAVVLDGEGQISAQCVLAKVQN